MITRKTLDFSIQEQSITAYQAQPSGGGPGIIVLHAWWGLTPFFKNLCDRLAEHGFTALAPDLYGGITAETIDQAWEALEYSSSSYKQAAVVGALEQIQDLPGVDAQCVGVIGFSMGAAWALELATLSPQAIKAVVLFYGTGDADFKQAQAAYQGHFAEVDEWEPGDGVQQMLAAMHSAGRQAEFFIYPGCGHWFFEDNRPDAYQPDAAALAWKRTLDFLNGELTNPG